MRINLKVLFGFFCLSIFLGCGQEGGDDTAPGKIEDLIFFTDPKALRFEGDSVSLDKENPPAKTYSLAWTATGDNGDEGKAAMYDLRWISEAGAKKYGIETDPCYRESEYLYSVYQESYPRKSGKVEIYSLIELGLRRGVRYHFCLWVLDEVGQASEPAHIQAEIPFLGVELKTRSPVSGFGEKVFGIGDFSKDQLRDLSVSSPSQGKVFIYSGVKEERLFWLGRIFGRQFKKTRPQYPKLQITGDPAGNFGFMVTALGNIDRFGEAQQTKVKKPDLAITSPSSGAGLVYLFRRTALHSLTTSDAWATIEGESAGDQLGFALASCNDLNQDKVPDFAVSAPGAGKVYVVMGQSSTISEPIVSGSITTVASVMIQGDPSARFGISLDCGSDLNGDNLPDLLIGADQENGATGAVYLFLGGDPGQINFRAINARNLPVQIDLTAGGQSDLVISGVNPGEEFGTSLAMLGEVSGANLARDFAVSAPGVGNGRIYIFFGGGKGFLGLNKMSFPASALASQADLILEGKPGELIGEQIAGRGDLNDDGYNDLASSDGKGKVLVYYLLPVHNPEKIKRQTFQAQAPITSFQLVSGFYHLGKTDLLIGVSSRNLAYILK